MVFEGFQSRPVPARKRRSWVFVLSVVAHGAVLLIGVVYSFWHVDELKMPSLTVTFVSGIPQAAPPPPAALGGGASAPKKPHAAKPKTAVKEPPKELVAPPEQPAKPAEAPKPTPVADEAPAHDEPKAATAGDTGGPPGPGIATGTPGGDPNVRTSGGIGQSTGNGNGAAPPVRTFRKFLPPTIAAQQKLGGNEPEFPAVLRRPGARYLVGAKICVGADGRVESIDIVQAGDPTLDARVREAVKSTWHYRPYTANGTPVPFCYRADFNFRAD